MAGRSQRILADAKRQEQLFGVPLASPIRGDDRQLRDERYRINVKVRDEAIEYAKRYPTQLLLAEFRPPHSRVWHFCVGGLDMTLCCQKCQLRKNEYRHPKSFRQILEKTSVDCQRCRKALGLAAFDEEDF